MKKIIKTIFILMISMLTTSIGISLLINLQYGSDTLTVLLEGVHVSLNVSIGTAAILCNGLLLIIAILLDKNNVKLTTVMFVLLIGSVLDYVSPIITTIIETINIKYISGFWLLIAQLCISFSFAFLINSKLGMQSLDVIIYYVIDNIDISYVTAKTIFDGIFLMIGGLLGGKIGLGTIISLLTTGILVRTWLKLFKRNYKLFRSETYI